MRENKNRGLFATHAAHAHKTLSSHARSPFAFFSLQLLTACEKEFGLVMPHGALNEVKSVDDAVSYWERRLAAVEEERIAAAKHYTVQHPPNVVIGGKGRGAVIREWQQQHGVRPHWDYRKDDPLAALGEDEQDDDGARIVVAGRSEGVP